MSDYFDRLFRYVSEQTYRHKLTDTLIAILRTPIRWGEAISVYGHSQLQLYKFSQRDIGCIFHR